MTNPTETVTRFTFTTKQRAFLNLTVSLDVVDAVEMLAIGAQHGGDWEAIVTDILETAFMDRTHEAGRVKHGQLCKLRDEIAADARAEKKADEPEALPKTNTDDETWDAQGRPVVGAGGTFSIGSDRYAFTVVEVSPSGHIVKVQHDLAKRTDRNGLSEDQEHEFYRDASAKVQTLTRRKGERDGRPVYQLKGCKGYGYARFGTRSAYLDPCF